MSKSHIHPPLTPLIHMHARPYTHRFPFSPALIMFLYLTFKVPEIGMFLNQNCFSRRALAETPIPVFWSCSAFWVILFWQPCAVSFAKRVITQMIWLWLEACRTHKTGDILSCFFCYPGSMFSPPFFPLQWNQSVVFERKPFQKPKVGKSGQMLCSGYEMESEGKTLVITQILTNSR